ncbi:MULTISPECIES: DNA translocase FtsK [unclassified Lentimonas]|uniref:FtsK/SpoIIIE family DNA translocase n=1 Tax=unclassified Lentimonas TaxID=2630993 RepID=UPI00132B6B02|nr:MULTISPECIES: DNA translocase FtsK [unclassified Lentimonas]CAA6690310.1 Cell division protein FtsK [Lentimonas sp. CC10]CAA6693041.1 Cell division protein FtsK [Lentimonas sp. CC19]CAA7069052.1 Cell division protein FtsK [Lentimonas sp. CC11]
MARNPKKKVARKKVVSQPRKAGSRPVWGLLSFFIAVCSFVAIWDFEIAQSRQHTTEPEMNLVGVFGAEMSFWAFHFIGVATWLVPLYLLWAGVRFILQQRPRRRLVSALATLASLICASGLASMMEAIGTAQMQGGIFEHQLSQGVGGVFGEFFATVVLQPFIGPFGSFLILLMGFVIGSVIVFTDNLGRFFDYIQNAYAAFLEGQAASKEERKTLKAERAEAKRLEKEEAAAAKAQVKADRAAAKAERAAEKAANKSKAPAKDEAEPDDEEDDDRPGSLLPASVSSPTGLKAGKKPTLKQPKSVMEEPQPPIEPVQEVEPPKPKFDPSMIKVVSEEKTEKAVASIPERRGDYVFPPLKLLSEPQAAGALHQEDHAGTMEALVRTLDEFGVKVIPGEIHTGPVITRYEVKPAPGVRVEKIVNLDKNIALGLQAMSVRILAPVPGKGTVGIEVPNKVSEAVCMRDIVESRAWAEADAEIPVVLGKDVTGKPMVMDLTKMPHVLIAGSTGSGKTVCINAIIASLLYHSGPEDLRFIMVDPKVVEMQMYNALPHMLIPVVTEAKKVPGALKWLIAEMEHRYQIFAKTNVRNIAGFNAKILKDKEEQAKAEAMDADMTPEERAAISKMDVPRDDDAFEIPKKKLPYIVCVIDELADLMMVAPADIETCIARIAQLARAAGIHLVLATQRPSVNVVTGVIKANLPSRISFKVASKIDSRTILDGGGAEALIGRGDMLFIPPGTSSLVRAQGAFVSDEEIEAIVEFLKENNDPPEIAQEVQQQIDAGGDEGGGLDAGGEEADELLPDAIDVLRSTKRASTSMLQRRLRIGYNRAARLMEVLEDRGIVGPENGSSPREILVDLDVM